jgi:hypothetical protein
MGVANARFIFMSCILFEFNGVHDVKNNNMDHCFACLIISCLCIYFYSLDWMPLVA